MAVVEKMYPSCNPVCPAPESCPGWSPPSNLAPPHKLWGPVHVDVESSEIPQTGSFIVYDGAIERWVLDGTTNIWAGPRTQNAIGTDNITLGRNCGTSLSLGTTIIPGGGNMIIGTESSSFGVSGSYNVVLGYQAGASIGQDTVCIGRFAGNSTSDQANVLPVASGNNNIYINASGTPLHSTTSGGLYIKPVATRAQGATPLPTNLPDGCLALAYDTTTGEVVTIT